jgi:ATP/maltotriose-dependent transcriptional regulator MalT/DNA-binding SARP family transcriptional activator
MTGSGSSRVVRTLLLPPRLPARCVPRQLLVDRILRALDDRAVLVLAGAGYGKTTLLAQARRADPRPWAWVSCDDRFTDDAAFLFHVTGAVAQRFPGVGARLTFAGTVADNVTALCDELIGTVPEDVVLALDDLHLLPPPASEALRRLLAELPPQVHLALAGRTAPPFPLARLRAHRVLQLDERALALDHAESAALLELLDPALSGHTATELHMRTEGWISGLILAAGSADRGARLSAAHEDSFDYLAEEVLRGRPQYERQFLEQTAILERFTPEIAGAVSGCSDSRAVIAGLLDAHLFTARLDADGEWYRYHPLFLEYLRSRTSVAPDAPALHRRAAAALHAAGEPTMAVPHHLAAGDRAAAADALEPLAEDLVMAPGAEQVAGWLAAIGADEWSRRPALVLAEASLQFTHGDYAAGVAALERVADQLADADEHDRAAVAYFRLVQALTWAGAPRDRCIALGERLLRRLDPATAMLPAAEIMLAAAYAHVGRYTDAERALDTALDRPGARQHPIFGVYASANRAYFLDFRRGDIHTAAARLDAAIAELEARDAEDVLAYRSWVHSYRGVLLSYLGRWTEAMHVVRDWPELATRQGFGRLAQQVSTWHRLAHLAGLERWNELAEELRRAAPLAACNPDTTFAQRYYSAAAQLAAAQGDAAGADRAIEHARATCCPPFPRAMVLADLALAAAGTGRRRTAAELGEAAWDAARAADAPWPLARAGLVAATVGAPGETADGRLSEALNLTQRLGYQELWSRRERPLAAPLLARALARGLGPPGAAAAVIAACGAEVLREAAALLTDAPAVARRQLLEAADEAGVLESAVVGRFLGDPDPAVRQAAECAQLRLRERPRPPVHILCLGGFAVQRPDTLLPDLAFTRRKARTLLAALVAAGGPVSRDVLLEQLWPQLAPDRALAALHTTLHDLRRSLQSGLGPTAAELVASEGERYRLALRDDDQEDAAEFLALAAALAAESAGPRAEPGGDRLQRAQAAEARYTGPFLPEWPYEGWAEPRRRTVARAHRDVLRIAAEELMAAGSPAAAVGRYEQLVELEPEREGGHRALMRAYARAGERALALRQYHACRALLRESLGVDPSPATQQLYASLL